MSSPVRQVETALLARLRSPRPYGGLVVESYAAQLDDDTFAWVRSLPAVWVTFDQVTEARKVGKHHYMVSATFEVLSAQRALTQDSRRLNEQQRGLDVGLYELIEDNKLLIVGQSLGLEIQPFTPGAVRPVMKGQALRDAVSVYSQTFATRWMEVIDPEVDTGDWLTLGLNYLLKPGDNTVDQADLVTLSP